VRNAARSEGESETRWKGEETASMRRSASPSGERDEARYAKMLRLLRRAMKSSSAGRRVKSL
jgi:hypothetical protein